MVERIRRKSVAVEAQQPESEQSLLSTLGSIGLSALSKAGNLLDLPGSSVRDILAGENPFDQWLSPLSHGATGKSVSGREMLASNILTSRLFSPNKETGISGWLSDPVEGLQDVAGFAAEMALDPVAWITAGTSKAATAGSRAANAAADAAKAASVAGDVASVVRAADPLLVAGKAVKLPAKGLARKALRALVVPLDVLNAVDPGTRIGRVINDQIMATGFGRNAVERMATLGRKAVEKVGSSAPARLIKQQLSPLAMGRISQEMQSGAATHVAKEASVIRKSSQSVSVLIDRIGDVVGFRASEIDPLNDSARAGQFNSVVDDVVEAIETNSFDSLDGRLVGAAKQMKSAFEEMQVEATSLGLRRADLQDLFADFFPHEWTSELDSWLSQSTFSHGGGGAASNVAISQRANQTARSSLFRNAAGGRRTWNAVTSDKEILDLVGINTPASKAKAAEKIAERYGTQIDPRMPEITEGAYQNTVRLRDQSTGQFTDVPIGDLESTWNRLPSGFDLSTEVGRRGEFSSPILYQHPESGITAELVQSSTNRYQALVEWMSGKTAPLREGGGVFASNGLTSAQRRIYRDANTIGGLKALPDILAGAVASGRIGHQIENGMKLSDMFDSDFFSHVDRRVIYGSMIDSSPALEAMTSGMSEAKRHAFITSMKMDPALKDEFEGAASMVQYASGNFLEPLSAAMRGSTAMFKAGVLTHPAFHVRNLFSALFALGYNDMVSMESLATGLPSFFGRANEELLLLPQVRAHLDTFGMEHTAENASRAVHQMYATLKGHAGSLYIDPNLDTLSQAEKISTGYASLEHAFPGTGITSVRSAGKQLKEAVKGGTYNPFDIAGVPHVVMTKGKVEAGIKRGTARTRSDFKISRVNDLVGKNVDDLPRFVGFLDGMFKGKSATEAWDAVTKVQLDYNPKAFGPLENAVLKKVFPFYSFMRQQTSYMAKELLTNPNGGLGKILRAYRIAQPKNEYLPEHISEGVAFPIGGKAEDGTQNYLTGFGFMFEDPPKVLMSGGPQEFLRQLLARSNPLIKGPAEYALGRSSFQGGPLGGRDLADMDPVLGRLFTQVGLQAELPGGQAAPAFGSRGLEFFLSNSPASRLLSTPKTLLDSRKSILQRGMVTLTGMRISSVSDQQRQRGVRELTDAIAKESGARPFTTFHISKGLLEDVSGDPEKAKRLEVIKKLREIWAARAKAERA